MAMDTRNTIRTRVMYVFYVPVWWFVLLLARCVFLQHATFVYHTEQEYWTNAIPSHHISHAAAARSVYRLCYEWKLFAVCLSPLWQTSEKRARGNINIGFLPLDLYCIRHHLLRAYCHTNFAKLNLQFHGEAFFINFPIPASWYIHCIAALLCATLRIVWLPASALLCLLRFNCVCVAVCAMSFGNAGIVSVPQRIKLNRIGVPSPVDTLSNQKHSQTKRSSQIDNWDWQTNTRNLQRNTTSQQCIGRDK